MLRLRILFRSKHIFCPHQDRSKANTIFAFHSLQRNAGLASRHITHTTSMPTYTTQPNVWKNNFDFPRSQLDWKFLCDPFNREFIRNNIIRRNGNGDIDKLCQLWVDYHNVSMLDREGLWSKVLSEGLKIPNISHPLSPVGDQSQSRLVHCCGQEKEFTFPPKTALEIGERLQLLRTDNVAPTTGSRTYYLIGDLALLEQALVAYTISILKTKGFHLISVPDILHPNVVEACGFETGGARTQVYHLSHQHGSYCLAGTAEMSIAGFFMNEVLDVEDLPMRMAAVSRCYRAETSPLADEKGLYRVHQFTKVEMFGLTADDGNKAAHLLQELVDIQEEICVSLGLHYRLQDMATEELGPSAHRKYDIETWMPGREFWGEISSASNCTDFQSRRLNIRYRDKHNSDNFVHTVNGTACAVPRMIMILLEDNQREDGSVVLPDVLKDWMPSLTLPVPKYKDQFHRIYDARRYDGSKTKKL